MDGVHDLAPTKARAWWQALRPKTLSLALAPVLVGTVWAFAVAGAWRLGVVVLAAVAATAIQVATNLWNDALDAERGVDDGVRLGPRRAVAAGWLRAGTVRHAALATFALAAVAGSGLVWLGGWPILAIGLAAIAFGLLYSAGPVPLAGTPLGEAAVLVFFGIAGVAGTVWLHGSEPTGEVWALGAFTGLPAAAVLLVNNHRDRASDARGGRRTLAILLGVEATRRLYGVLLLSAAAGPVILRPTSFVAWLITGALAAAAWRLARGFMSAPLERGLNRFLVRTARYQLFLVLGFLVLFLAHG